MGRARATLQPATRSLGLPRAGSPILQRQTQGAPFYSPGILCDCLWFPGSRNRVAWIASFSLMLNNSSKLIKARQAKVLLRPWGSNLVMEFHSWGKAGLLQEWVTWLWGSR